MDLEVEEGSSSAVGRIGLVLFCGVLSFNL